MVSATGTSTVNEKPTRPATRRRAVRLKLDLPLLVASVSLLVFGILMVYSASWDYSYQQYGNAGLMFQRQLMWLGLGLIVAVALTIIDYHVWQKLAVPAMVFTLLLLIVVLLVNEVRNNAVRTLIGGSVQPSELAKIVMVLYLSVWLYARRDQLKDVNLGLFPLAVILGVLGGLIIVQPDLSAVVTIFILGGTLFFLAGADLRQIFLLVVVALLVGAVVVQLNPTGNERINDYLPGLRDPLSAHYHVRRALEAFSNGGWLGVGIGKSETKLTGLPVPPTDSIYAVVGEETGVLGAAIVLILYTVVLWRGLLIARRAPDGLGTLMASGLTLWIVWEAYINMAVMVNMLPFAGNALPLISAGGSNLLVTLASIGILMNISRLSIQTQEEDGKLFNSVVDLRRRYGRRRVSRAERAEKPVRARSR
jgi:cell division protein FtsW